MWVSTLQNFALFRFLPTLPLFVKDRGNDWKLAAQ